jgi:hypothetical protein
MADVIIKGNVREDGSFEIKLNDAVQKKLFGQVTQSLEKTAKKQENPKLNKLIQDLAKTINKSGNTNSDEISKILGRSGKQKFAETVEMAASRNPYVAAFKGLAAPFNVLKEVVGDMAKTVMKTDVEFGDLSQILERQVEKIPVFGGIMATGLSLFAEFVDKSVDSFRNLSQVGGAFNNSLIELRRTALVSGLTIDEFGSVVRQNADRFAALTGSVTTGSRAFAEITRSVRNYNNGELFNLGVGTEELNELIADSLTILRRNNQLTIGDRIGTANASAELIKQFDLLAKLTGKSRSESAKTILALQSENDFRQLTSQLLSKTSKENVSSLQNITGVLADAFPELRGSILNIISTGSVTNELGRALGGTGSRFVSLLQMLSREARDGTLTQSKVNALLPEFQKASEGIISRFTRLAQLGVPVEGAVGDVVRNLFRFQDFLAKRFDPERVKEEQRITDALTNATTRINNAFRLLRTRILTAFIDSNLFGKFADRVGEFVNYLLKYLPAIGSGVEKMLDAVDYFVHNLFSEQGRDRIVKSIILMFRQIFQVVAESLSDMPIFGSYFGRVAKRQESQMEILRKDISKLDEDLKLTQKIKQLEYKIDRDKEMLKTTGKGTLTAGERQKVVDEIKILEGSRTKTTGFKELQAEQLSKTIQRMYQDKFGDKNYDAVRKQKIITTMMSRPDVVRDIMSTMQIQPENFKQLLQNEAVVSKFQELNANNKEYLRYMKESVKMLEKIDAHTRNTATSSLQTANNTKEGNKFAKTGN